MNLIVAVDENFGIGKNNDLLISIPEDMKRFRQITSLKTVVMGRKTYDSLHIKPLPKRNNIVITKTEDKESFDKSVVVYNDMNKFISDYKDNDDVFVIGGAQIYNQLMPYCKYAYITHIYKNFYADTFMNKLDKDWEKIEESDLKSYNDIKYRYCLYRNINIQ